MAKPGNHAIALGGQGSAPAVQHRQLALPPSVNMFVHPWSKYSSKNVIERLGEKITALAVIHIT